MDAADAYREEQDLLDDLAGQSIPLQPPHAELAKTRNLYVLLVGISVYILAIVSTAVAEIDVLYLMICFNKSIERDECFQNPEVSTLAASFASYCSIIRGLAGVLVFPYLSSLSDRFGRKPLFILTMSLMALGRALQWCMLFGTKHSPNYMYLLIPTVIEASGGSYYSVSSLGISCISDIVTNPQERATFISWCEAATFFALSVGPTAGSKIIQHFSLSSLYKWSAMLAFGVVVYIMIFVRETLPRRVRKNVRNDGVRIFEKLKLITFNHVADPVQRRSARIFALCAILGTEFILSIISVMMIYVKKRFNWSAVELGYMVTCIAGERFLALTFGFPFLFKVFSKIYTVHKNEIDRVDVTFLRIAIALCALGFTGMGLSPGPPAYIACVALEACASIATPVFKYALVKYAPEGEYGTFLASYAFACSIPQLILPALFLRIYGLVVNTFPTLPFFLIGGLFSSVLFLSVFTRPKN